MNMNKLIIMTVSSILLAACAGNQVARQWASMPVSEDTDAQQLAASIKANPAEWKAAADFLSRQDLGSLPLGRYDLTPAGTYANIQEYDTRSVGKYEAHRAYADVQVVLSGEEYIFFAPLDALQDRLTDFDEEKDIEFFASASSERAVLADRTHWVILFPSDAHNPCMSRGESPVHVRKVVVKVKV